MSRWIEPSNLTFPLSNEISFAAGNTVKMPGHIAPQLLALAALVRVVVELPPALLLSAASGVALAGA